MTRESKIEDSMVRGPIRFWVKDQKFEIYPPTLGKMQVLSGLYLQLDIDEQAFSEQPHREAMRVCQKSTDTACSLMAVATLSTQGELLDDELIAQMAEFFKWNCYPEDFARCLMAILPQVDYSIGPPLYFFVKKYQKTFKI